MSQEKVARYKEEKANRKSIMKKQKITKIVRGVTISLVCLVTVGWIGWSGVDYYQTNKPREQVEVDYTVVDDYVTGLTQE